MLETDRTLTDEERFPLITQPGRELLRRMWEHPHAPTFNHRCGDRLSREGLERIRSYEKELKAAQRGWSPGQVPDWVRSFARECIADVPIYRSSAAYAEDFFALPTVSRADIGREPWSFVPDSQPLDELIYYGTTGTTGHPLKILSHPEVSSQYLPLLRAALSLHDVSLDGGNGRVSIIVICAQNYTYTYASVSSFLNEAGFLKLNLNPLEWRDPDDRALFLDDLDPEIYSGDPVSFFELAKIKLKSRPKALVSTAMALLPGWKDTLENHFGCPVIDLYSSNECRLIAAAVEGGHMIIPHDLYIEILDDAGRPCAAGVRGEITLTCGRNPFLPLLRYQTGDYASLEFRGTLPLLVGLEGRPPTLFVASDGKILNNIDISLILYPFPFAQFTLHQYADRSIVFKMRGSVDERQIRDCLLKVFGAAQQLKIEALADADTKGGKVVQYTSDIRDIDLSCNERSYQKMTWQQILNPGT